MNTVFLKTPHSTHVQGRFPTRLTKMFAANRRQMSLVVDDITLLVIEIPYNLSMREA